MDEHRDIESVLGALEGYAERLESPEEVVQEDLPRFVEFVRQYADARHHGKEEDLLFAAMVKNGFPREEGPLAVMYTEHDEGRRLVGLLAELGNREGTWENLARHHGAESARRFTSLLRAHIFKEDHVLYPMAADQLPAEVLAELDAQGEALDEQGRASGHYPRLRALAEDLVSRYGRPDSGAASPP